MSTSSSVWWAEYSIEELRPEGGRFRSTVGAQQFEVVFRAEYIGGDAPGVAGEILRFPRGDLRGQTAELFALDDREFILA